MRPPRNRYRTAHGVGGGIGAVLGVLMLLAMGLSFLAALTTLVVVGAVVVAIYMLMDALF